MPRTIRVRIEDELYEKLKNTILRYSTWNDVVNEALAKLLQEHLDSPHEKAKAVIVEFYYKTKRLKRLIMMLQVVEHDYLRLVRHIDIDNDPTLVRLVSELGEVIQEMKRRLKELDEEEMRRIKEEKLKQLESLGGGNGGGEVQTG